MESGCKNFPFVMVKVTLMLLLFFMSKELIQSCLLTSVAPVVLEWKDVQTERCVQLKQ